MIFLYILLALLILLIMITIHELGHYTAGKLLKFKINEFAVGFGPKLLSKTNKSGEQISLRLVPLGGYCAFEGETDDEERPLEKAFTNEKPWKRLIVFVAGAGFNFISAIIFSFIFILAVGYAVPKVSSFYYDGAGAPYAAELREGDLITEVGGKKISVMNSFADYTQDLSEGDTVTLTVIRGGASKQVLVKLQQIDYIDDEGNSQSYTGFGISTETVYQKAGVGHALTYCVPFTLKLSWAILGAFGQMITGRVPITQMSGPVGTIGYMAQVSMVDWRYIFMLLPLIAANLAVFNLLPIPALDGSKIVFTLIEWIRKKPVNRTVENYIHLAGLVVLLLFVIVVDILSFALR